MRFASPKYGVVEGSGVRRRAKNVSNAIRAPKSVPDTPHSAPKSAEHSSRPRRLNLTRQGYFLLPRKYIATIVPLPKTRPPMSTERISSKTVDETGRFRRSN